MGLGWGSSSDLGLAAHTPVGQLGLADLGGAQFVYLIDTKSEVVGLPHVSHPPSTSRLLGI